MTESPFCFSHETTTELREQLGNAADVLVPHLERLAALYLAWPATAEQNQTWRENTGVEMRRLIRTLRRASAQVEKLTSDALMAINRPSSIGDMISYRSLPSWLETTAASARETACKLNSYVPRRRGGRPNEPRWELARIIAVLFWLNGLDVKASPTGQFGCVFRAVLKAVEPNWNGELLDAIRAAARRVRGANVDLYELMRQSARFETMAFWMAVFRAVPPSGDSVA